LALAAFAAPRHSSKHKNMSSAPPPFCLDF
jgi:hypothetical protein